jgi:hypothetical protein
MRRELGLKRPIWAVFAIAVCAGACQREKENAPQKPAWFYATKISAKGAKRAFANNTEVVVDIENKTKEPVMIQGLGTEGSVVLVHEGGSEAKPHRISVGVAKPVTIPASGTRTTSFLFEAKEGTPRRLRIYGREHAIP